MRVAASPEMSYDYEATLCAHEDRYDSTDRRL